MVIWMFLLCVNGTCERIPVQTQEQCMAMIRSHGDGVCMAIPIRKSELAVRSE